MVHAMVSKLAATPSTKTVEPTASKAAPAKATPNTVAKKKVAKPAALPAKKAVSVGSKPIAQGVTNMTDTVKATAEKATRIRQEKFRRCSGCGERIDGRQITNRFR